MSVSFRTAILVAASLASASVAPAQIVSGNLSPASFSVPSPEPLIASNALPRTVEPTIIVLSTDAAPEAQSDQQNASEINSVTTETLAAMVGRLGSGAAATREGECLATAIYFEAKSEPLAGQLAVGEVLANRVKSGRFASSYCGVVMQPGQFSFVHGSALPSVPRSGRQWKNAVAVAAIVLARLRASEAPRALFFHAKRVSPNWRLTRVAEIGNHIFYR